MADGQPSQVIYASGSISIDGAPVGLAREVILEATYVQASIEAEDRGGALVDAFQSAWSVTLSAEFRGLDGDLSQLIPAFSAKSAGRLLRPSKVVFTSDSGFNPSFVLENAIMDTARLRMRFAPNVELVRAISWNAIHPNLEDILTITPGS